ncbi:MAG TPA: copper chaperone PCu(A)C [Stellaceae bacterium]|nr:copper chaperone PCu(A)C [Stellaceae bacterium]
MAALPFSRRALFLGPLGLVALARPAAAHSFTLATIEIGHPWALPSVSDTAAIFMALAIHGQETDRLIGADSPIAREMLLRDQDGAPLDFVELVPRRPIALRPGRRYLEMTGLQAPLAIDDSFPVTLHFHRSGSVMITVMVEEGPEQ